MIVETSSAKIRWLEYYENNTYFWRKETPSAARLTLPLPKFKLSTIISVKVMIHVRYRNRRSSYEILRHDTFARYQFGTSDTDDSLPTKKSTLHQLDAKLFFHMCVAWDVQIDSRDIFESL